MWIFKRITFQNSSVQLAVPKGNYVVLRKFLHVTTAFDAGTNNNISFGYTGSTQAFGTNTAAATTGLKSVSDGAATGFNSTSRAINCYYAQSGTPATAGSAIVGIEIEASPA